MSLPEFAQIEEDNERLRDQLADMENELSEAKHEINELKAQMNAKEEGATTHRETESRDGWVWTREVTVIAPEWKLSHRAVA